MQQRVFDKMIKISQIALAKKHEKGGRTPELSIGYILLMELEYLREYRTYASIGADFGLDESNVFRWVRWCEDVLMDSREMAELAEKIKKRGFQ